MIGKIIKGIAGFYYVKIDNNIFECKAKGKFRNDNLKPIIGDVVDIDIIDEVKYLGNIIHIYDRKNELIRPAVCNIDVIGIVLAKDKPKPLPLLIDKYIISLLDKNVDIILIWNKDDILNDNTIYDEYKKAGFSSFIISVKDDRGIDTLLSFINGKTIALAGPSGVGKSSLINKLCPKANMETNAISRKIDRGKHTTRHSELFSINDNTFIFDTPGFSNVDISNIKKEELKYYYHEFNIKDKCKYNGCMHINEPNCKIKELVNTKQISETRYLNYIKIYNELAQTKKY